MPSSACPGRQELKLYAVGKLDEQRSEEIDTHVVDCLDCQAMLDTIGFGEDTLLQSLKQPVEPDEYLREPECEEAIALVEAIGRDPSFAAAAPHADHQAEPADLGQVHVYKLLAKLGEGGMGAVYKALHVHLNKVVALKLLPKEQTEDELSVARFKREMVAVGALEHPNIVAAHDAGEHEGKHFLVMEYVKGQDLSRLSKRLGPLPIAEACELIRRAAVGLQHAHEAGLVHRDIKPSNLMLSESGEVKILDLGLALLEEQQADKPRDLTTTGQMMGTIDYMAPEQGDDSHEVDIRADIYGLGATLYKLLTGEPPYGDSKYNTPIKKLMALATEPAPPISAQRDDIPADVAVVIHRMLEKDPDQRPATPAEVANLLGPFATGSNLFSLLGSSSADSQTADEPRSRSTASHFSSALQATTMHRQKPQPEPASQGANGKTEIYVPAPAPGDVRRRWFSPIFGLALGFAAIVMLGIVFLLRTPTGVLRIEINDPNLTVLVDGKEISLTDKKWKGKQKAAKHQLAIKLGDQQLKIGSPTVFQIADESVEHHVTVKLNDVALSSNEFDVVRNGETVLAISYTSSDVSAASATLYPQNAPRLAIAPFDAATAKQHQQAWADYLRLPVERDIELPGGEKLTMVLIPPGEFMMGSTAADQAKFLEAAKAANNKWGVDQIPSEGPQHCVRITKPLYLGKYEVTQAQWQAVMGSNPSNFKNNPTHPVEQVSWDDIRPFLAKLNDVPSTDKMKFALPTEAQWEYACRAGRAKDWFSGDSEEDLRQYGWFGGNSGGKTHPVGELKPNGFGLYDMHGNVWEWCADWFARDYYAKAPVDDPTGPAAGSSRVNRGQCWRYPPRNCPLAHRGDYGPPGYRASSIGFRLAATIDISKVKRSQTRVNESILPPAPKLAGPSPLDALKREAIDPYELAMAGGGDPAQAPTALTAILGDSRLKHWNTVTSVVFSPDGKTVASSSVDGTIKLWDVDSGKERLTLTGHVAPIHSVVFNPDGKTLASASWDETIKLWDVANGKLRRSLTGHVAGVRSVVYSRDGKTLASASEDQTVILWDTTTGTVRRKLAGHTDGVFSVAFSPDGTTLASSSRDGTIKLWDAAEGTERVTLTGHGETSHRGAVGAVVFSPDGATLASAGQDKSVRLWDVASGKERHQLKGHSWGVWGVAFSPDGKMLASASSETILWDATTGKLRHIPSGSGTSVAFSPDGATLAVGGRDDNRVKLWDVATGKEHGLVTRHTAALCTVAFSPDGTALASAGWDQKIRLWDTATGRNRITLAEHSDSVYQVVFSPDGATLASASQDRTIRLWNAMTGHVRISNNEHAKPVDSVAFSPDGSTFASAARDGTIRLWNAKTGSNLLTLSIDRPTSVAFSPSGKTLPSASKDGTIKLWDAMTGNIRLTLTGHSNKVLHVAFSPAGTTLASASEDQKIKLWDPVTGEMRHTLAGHTNAVFSIAFSPAGGRLASAGADGTVRLWDAKDGQPLATLQLGPAWGDIRQVAFDPTGQYLATANGNGTIYILRVAP